MAEIEKNGTFTLKAAAVDIINNWDYQRTILRQDEVANFIRDTKGSKYSALLPLLGLNQMEVAAENLRQLVKSVKKESNLIQNNTVLNDADTKRKKVFGNASDKDIFDTLDVLYLRYCSDKNKTTDTIACCKEIKTALDTKVTNFSTDQKRYLTLRDVASLDFKGQIATVRSHSAKLSEVVEPFIIERLEILKAASRFADKLGKEKEINCPACGRLISVELFQAHIIDEKERLQDILNTFNKRKASIGTLCDDLKSLKSSLNKEDVKSWRDEISEGILVDCFTYLNGIDSETLRTSCTEVDLKDIEDKLVPIVEAAVTGSKDAPLDVRQLSNDKLTVDAANTVIEISEIAAAVTRTSVLVSFLDTLEQGIREEIRSQSEKVIDEISTDVQSMWSILHPGESIDDVKLYLPEDSDKAIDIGLKFHGVEQDSPRLTLSEGNRNSLGLCIFLSMAKREADNDRPLFLDDVVVSLDRHHRGMIQELLDKEFGQRQVILLTHDREWYTELRQQLDNNQWIFKALLPYENPNLGIRWSHKTTTFDDARALLIIRPDSAGTDARKIMDIELAFIAEHLQIRMPYLRADKKDKRLAHDFLERIIADGKTCFQKKTDTVYESYRDAIIAFEKTDSLLVSWANRGTHTFDIVRPEAVKLIDACEKALESFKCLLCGKSVWFADAEGAEWVQCQCGQLRWRYGKG
ncbi:MAG: hypothetical protein HY757_02250 [Nitrospirae bacterium]|nr:hypothetical protein [Nitrospirota bacterium]